MEHVGTMSIGVRAPIIRMGDNLPQIVAQSILSASEELNLPVEDGDVIAITESVVARAEGNYVSVDEIAEDIERKFGDSQIALVHPILSRNRFAMCLKGICRGAKGGIIIVLSLPSDEVGNHLISKEQYLASGLDKKDVITEEEFRAHFPTISHEFTHVDYIEYYKSIAKEEKCEVKVLFANDPTKIVEYTKYFIACDIHTRKVTKLMLINAGAKTVFGLDNICSSPIRSGFNPEYGLLGSNRANEETLKLLPKNASHVVIKTSILIHDATKKNVEVLVYGDGAFKDPVGKIWELADPVVGVAYSNGLHGRPNELKLKALADDKFQNLSGQELRDAITAEIKNKEKDLVGQMASEGTTPRQLTDLIGSLADLTSGSGDKGTPIVWIKGYFKNYAD